MKRKQKFYYVRRPVSYVLGVLCVVQILSLPCMQARQAYSLPASAYADAVGRQELAEQKKLAKQEKKQQKAEKKERKKKIKLLEKELKSVRKKLEMAENKWNQSREVLRADDRESIEAWAHYDALQRDGPKKRAWKYAEKLSQRVQEERKRLAAEKAVSLDPMKKRIQSLEGQIAALQG